ncbi:MAG: hypothetical protein LUD72_11305 [Bacteroidales bacterium]|nr:hypothetical protein [Bacteroidales bacterium]
MKSLKAVYTDPKFIPDQEAFEVWYGLLRDLDYRAAMAAAKAHMLTNRFPPAVAEIRDQCAKIALGDQMSGMEAWDLLYRAIQNSAWEARAQFEKLPTDIQKAVGSANQLHSWATDENFSESVVMSHFLRAYDAVQARKREKAKLTPDILQIIEQNNSIERKARRLGG